MSKNSQFDYRGELVVKPGSTVDLSEINTAFTGPFSAGKSGEKQAKKLLKVNRAKIDELQTRMYAEGDSSLLLVMQAMDAAGKDGTIAKVFGAMRPQGVRAVSFKKPSELERDHHFLWRVRQNEPPKGHTAIFNRSHYEDVLIVRVRDFVDEKVWGKHFDTADEFWEARYKEINDFEKSLAQNDTQILKFFLHISPEEQLKRFWDRANEPDKNWKLNPGDFEERKLWDDYQKAYETALSKCSTEDAPWFVIPADNKWFARAAISQILVDHLESLGMKYPESEITSDEAKSRYFGVKNPGDKPRFDLS